MLIMAIVLPVMLLLLFTYVFGGAMDVGTAYIQYATPRDHPAVRRFRCRQHGDRGGAGHVGGFVDRYRSMPVAHPRC